MRIVEAADVAALGYPAAIEAVRAALRESVDPASDPPRWAVSLTSGQFLIMPSEGTARAGIKIVSIAPDNPSRGLPRIQALYLLFDAQTLTPRALLDGTALTTLRTPAVSMAAVLDVLPERPLRVAILGAGPQAIGHVEAAAAVRELAEVSYLVRDPGRAAVAALALGSQAARGALSAADVIVCATSAREPLFDSAVVRAHAVVIAVGSHEPDARELDADLLRRSTVIVEDVRTAMREAGDVVLAVDEGACAAGDLLSMRDVITGRAGVPADRPVIFKSVGMAWQDLVVAQAVMETLDGS